MQPFDIMGQLAALDLGAAAARGVWMPLAHPVSGAPLENDGVPIRLQVAGLEAPAVKPAVRALVALGADAAPEQLEAALLDQVVACTIGWDGVPLEYTPANVRVFFETWDWAIGQVLSLVSDRERFLGN